jgi:hypothetical protein
MQLCAIDLVRIGRGCLVNASRRFAQSLNQSDYARKDGVVGVLTINDLSSRSATRRHWQICWQIRGFRGALGEKGPRKIIKLLI